MADVQLRIGHLQFGAISNSSGVYVGQSMQTGWRGSQKANQGFGKTTGEENRVHIKTNVLDGDFIDTLVWSKQASSTGPTLFHQS